MWHWGCEIRSALHEEGGVADGCVLQDPNRGEAVGAAAVGKSGVFQSETDVEGNDGVEAEGFIHHVLEGISFASRFLHDNGSGELPLAYLQILHSLQIRIRRWAIQPDLTHDLGTQLLDYFGVPRQLIECPGQSRGSGISSSQQHSDQLIAKHLSITGKGC